MQLRNIMLLKVSLETAEKLIIGMPDELNRLRKLAENTDLTVIMNQLNTLQECHERMTKVMNRRVEFEMALIKLCGNVNNIHETMLQTDSLRYSPQTALPLRQSLFPALI